MSKLKNQLTISGYDTDKDLNTEIIVKANTESDLEMILQGIENLVETIDPKHVCKEDFTAYNDSMKRILHAVADNIGFQSDWYRTNPNIEMHYDEKSEESYVTDKSKIEILESFIEMIKQ